MSEGRDPEYDKLLTHHLAGGARVPCGTCTECCRGPNRNLYMDIIPEADLTRFTLEWRDNGRPVLATQANGDCLYLIDSKCSIYKRRPQVCRAFDCRDFAATDWQPKHISDAAQRLQE